MESVKRTVQRRVYRRRRSERRNRGGGEHQQVNRCVPKVNQRQIEKKTKQKNPTRLVFSRGKKLYGTNESDKSHMIGCALLKMASQAGTDLCTDHGTDLCSPCQ